MRFANRIAESIGEYCVAAFSHQVNGGRKVAGIDALAQEGRNGFVTLYLNARMLAHPIGSLKARAKEPSTRLDGRPDSHGVFVNLVQGAEGQRQRPASVFARDNGLSAVTGCIKK